MMPMKHGSHILRQFFQQKKFVFNEKMAKNRNTQATAAD